MTSKQRVKDLSIELGLNNKDMLQVLRDLGIQVRSHMSSLTDEEVDQIRARVKGGAQAASVVSREVIQPGVIVRRRKRVENEQPSPVPVETAPAETAAPPEPEFPAARPVISKEVEEPKAPEEFEEAAPASETAAPELSEARSVQGAAEEPVIESKEEAPEPSLPESMPEETEQAQPETDEEYEAEEMEEIAEVEPQTVEHREAAEGQEAGGAVKEPAEGQDTAEQETGEGRRRKRKKQKKLPPPPPQVRVISRPEPAPVQPAAPAGPPRGAEEARPPRGPHEGRPFRREGGRPDMREAPKAPVATTEEESRRGKRDKRVVEFAPTSTDDEERRKASLQIKKKKTVEVKDKTGGKVRSRKRKFHEADEYSPGQGRGYGAQAAQGPSTQPIKAAKRKIRVEEFIRVSDMAHQMGVKAPEVIKILLGLGTMATINQTLDLDTAGLVAAEFGYEVEKVGFTEEEYLAQTDEGTTEDLKLRPPVVTIMGHVDHGKTSLLDAIRKTNVTAGEAGGITQHIGAYHVKTPKGQITFLDTPGHEAFTAMRARGAQVTDIVVLVVAADDGVMDQTREAVNHSKAAGVPIVVAVNKIDKENANPDRVKRELADLGLVPEEWGGDTIFAHVSAKQRIGIDELLEFILLQAEVLELKANPGKRARGHIVEAKLDKGRGPIGTVLIQEGTLHHGDIFVCGNYFGKVRALFNDQGKKIKEAGPAIPVEVQGFDGVPEAGDEFICVEDEKVARRIADNRQMKQREKALAKESKVTLESFLAAKAGEETKVLNLIMKADVQGSLEAVTEAVNKLSVEAVKVNVIHGGTGAITESDIMLAAASQAIIIGFNVRPIAKVKDIAEREKVEIRFYDIIYKLVSDIKDAMSGMLAPVMTEVYLGQAEVRNTFNVPKVGTVAGCAVMDGKLTRNAGVRLLRNGVVTYTGRLASLKRFKDDVKEVVKGYECGAGLENFNDIKVGDIIEAFEEVAQKQTLS